MTRLGPACLLLLASCGGVERTSLHEPSRAAAADDSVEGAYARQAELRFVEFTRLAERRFAVPVSAGDVAAYRAANEAELRALFEQNRQRWTDLEPQVRARHILVSTTGAEPPQAARVRAEQIRRGILDGADFATVAAAQSDDAGSAVRGGDLGYFPRGRMVAAFDAVAFGLAEGRVSDVFESRFGFHIIEVTGRREGTLGFEEVAPELAERGARNRARRERMHAAAADVVERVEGGATLEAAAHAVLPERPPAVVGRAVYQGVPWPFRPALRDHVARSEAYVPRWVESLEGDREVIVIVVARTEADPANLTPEVAACIRARRAEGTCDESYDDGPCRACVPDVQRALDAVGDASPRRSPVPLRVLMPARPLATR